MTLLSPIDDQMHSDYAPNEPFQSGLPLNEADLDPDVSQVQALQVSCLKSWNYEGMDEEDAEASQCEAFSDLYPKHTGITEDPLEMTSELFDRLSIPVDLVERALLDTLSRHTCMGLLKVKSSTGTARMNSQQQHGDEDVFGAVSRRGHGLMSRGQSCHWRTDTNVLDHLMTSLPTYEWLIL